MKCVKNEVIGRHVETGPTQLVIDKLTAKTLSCGENVEPIVDINEIMSRCDVSFITRNEGPVNDSKILSL